MAKKSELIYLKENVYEAALDRIDRIYNSHDEVWVSFSGGKDSLAMLKLVEEYFDNEGISDKINVLFRDEEMINTFVRDYVMTFVDNPRYNFRYYTTQLESEIYILGQKRKYIQWDENRKWIIPKPEIGITLKGVYNQYNFDKAVFNKQNKRVCSLIGIRASESLLRFSGITMSKVAYMTKNPHMRNNTMGKPIYDWEEKDVFRYFYDKKIDYCEIYDMQIFNKDSLRVATVIHAEAAKQLYKVKTIDPILYDQIMEVFPEIELQARYYKDVIKGKAEKIIYEFKEKAGGDAWGAIYLYIQEKLTDPYQFKTAMNKVTRARKTRGNNVRHENPFGGYPAYYIFTQVISGAYKRNLMPTPVQKKIYFEYENMSVRA
jgi:predicted phosphoadenosine phosphosulfate sulfurtransferase